MELVRIGSFDTKKGGTLIDQIHRAMESTWFEPFASFPKYVKGGSGFHLGNEGNDCNRMPSADVTLAVPVVEMHSNDAGGYFTYWYFFDNLFTFLYKIGGGLCMDNNDMDPHVSMLHGIKLKSSYN